MTVDTSKPTSRRAVLGAALGGAAAVGIHALASAPGVRAVDEPLLLNVGNAGTASTSLSASLTQDTVFGVSNSGSEGTAIQGASDDGTGLAGYTTTGNGVYADSMGVAGYGLHATGGGGAAVWAASGDTSGALTHDSAPSTDETGVYGYCDVSETNSAGVWGDSNQSAGVVGTGSTGVIGAGGWGVWGYSWELRRRRCLRRLGRPQRHGPRRQRQGPLQPQRQALVLEDAGHEVARGHRGDLRQQRDRDDPGEQERPLCEGRGRRDQQDHDLPEQGAGSHRQGGLAHPRLRGHRGDL